MKLTREMLNMMIEREMKERYGIDNNNVQVICEGDEDQTPRLTREHIKRMIEEIMRTAIHIDGRVLLDPPSSGTLSTWERTSLL